MTIPQTLVSARHNSKIPTARYWEFLP